MAHYRRVANSIMSMAFRYHSPYICHRRGLRTMAFTLSRKLNPVAHIMVRPSPTCPPEFLRKMHRGILAAEFGSITNAVEGWRSEEVELEGQRSSVVIFGAGRVGNYLPDQIIPLFDVKNIILVDKNQANCKALFDKVKTNFPRTSVLGIVSDVTHPDNVEEALQKAVSHSNGPLDIIINAINMTREENQEDGLKPLTATLVNFQQQCLGKLKPRGQFDNFDSSHGLPPSMYDDSTVRQYRSLSRSAQAPEVKTSSYIKECVDRIAQTRHLRTHGKVMFTFAKPPRLIDE